MKFLFKQINLDTIVPYMKLWENTKQRSSDYSVGVLLCWARALGYQFAFDEDEELVWIRGTQPCEHFLAPVGKWNIKGWDELIAARFGTTAEFRIVPEKLVEIWSKQMPGHVFVRDDAEDRDSFEYLHKVSDLAALAGKKYIKKRNRVNQFSKMNPYTYLPITSELIPRIIEFQRAWCESYRIFSGYETIEQESSGIIGEILMNWDSLPMMIGGAIEVMGRIVAYTVAETAGDTLMIHFEKASLDFNAAYQVINQEFLLHEGEPYKYVNREEDMGNLGLRDAKMSYHPIGFVKKYAVRISL